MSDSRSGTTVTVDSMGAWIDPAPTRWVGEHFVAIIAFKSVKLGFCYDWLLMPYSLRLKPYTLSRPDDEMAGQRRDGAAE